MAAEWDGGEINNIIILSADRNFHLEKNKKTRLFYEDTEEKSKEGIFRWGSKCE